MLLRLALVLLAALVWGSSIPARADDPITITIRNHRFEPAEIKIPAGKRVSVVVVNDDPTPEEFEGSGIKVEKVIPGKSKALVRIGPLAKGRYDFMGEFNQATAKGVVIVE
jgi:hypothetical protein